IGKSTRGTKTSSPSTRTAWRPRPPAAARFDRSRARIETDRARARGPPSIGHFALEMHIVNHDVAASRRHLHIVATRQRALGVVLAALPMLAHGRGRELIVFGVAFIR